MSDSKKEKLAIVEMAKKQADARNRIVAEVAFFQGLCGAEFKYENMKDLVDTLLVGEMATKEEDK